MAMHKQGMIAARGSCRNSYFGLHQSNGMMVSFVSIKRMIDTVLLSIRSMIDGDHCLAKSSIAPNGAISASSRPIMIALFVLPHQKQVHASKSRCSTNGDATPKPATAEPTHTSSTVYRCPVGSQTQPTIDTSTAATHTWARYARTVAKRRRRQLAR